MILKILKYTLLTLVFVLLTAISQVGGVVFLISYFISGRIKTRFRCKGVLVFVVLYVATTFLIVPLLAPLSGRVKIDNTGNLKPASFLTAILNRNYVTPELNNYLQQASADLAVAAPNLELRYIDACFPFINGFPLLPHLSHNDGKKIDFSLVYQTPGGKWVNKSKSVSGYGVFEEPINGEFNQTDFCKKKGYFQYDFPKYLTLGTMNNDLEFSPAGTKIVINCLLKQQQLSKLFIEHHLKKRMNLTDTRIRFQGCGAVRHDDHIHIQIR